MPVSLLQWEIQFNQSTIYEASDTKSHTKISPKTACCAVDVSKPAQ